jgi:Tfp pilus assembly protein PilF
MFLETLMRLTPPAIALAALFATVSSVSHGQRPLVTVNARSLMLQRQGEQAAAAGQFEAANDALESALAVDPGNRGAFLSLANVASRQGLNGKSIRLYREALLLEPDDVVALAGQGAAMAAKGALGKARENLARVNSLCVKRCVQQEQLAAAIARGPIAPPQSAQVVPTLAVPNPAPR